jgi:hypothetical protein
MPKAQWRDPTKENTWRRLLRQWQRSGLTGRGFCAAHGLSEASFYAWRRELARRDQENGVNDAAPRPAFLKLAVDASTSLAPAIDVVLAEGRLLRVRPGFDADLLRQLLQVLEESSC